MHELSIAQAILQIALRHARQDTRITSVHVRVGHLRQIVPDALAFAWELSAQGTPAEGAELELEAVPIAVSCRACQAEGELDGFPLACRTCGSFAVDVIRGEELTVEAIELEHATTTTTRSG